MTWPRCYPALIPAALDLCGLVAIQLWGSGDMSGSQDGHILTKYCLSDKYHLFVYLQLSPRLLPLTLATARTTHLACSVSKLPKTHCSWSLAPCHDQKILAPSPAQASASLPPPTPCTVVAPFLSLHSWLGRQSLSLLGRSDHEEPCPDL